MQAINTPGVIPNVQSAWDTFVTDKCSEATHEAMNVYITVMLSKLSNQLPCDSEEIRKCHETTFDQAVGEFQAETIGISSIATERYLNELAVRNFTDCLNIPHSVLWNKMMPTNFCKLRPFSFPNIFVGMNKIFDK